MEYALGEEAEASLEVWDLVVEEGGLVANFVKPLLKWGLGRLA